MRTPRHGGCRGGASLGTTDYALRYARVGGVDTEARWPSRDGRRWQGLHAYGVRD